MTAKSDNGGVAERVALYPGSFNPFTRGHLDIVERTLAIADRVIIAVGVNVQKCGDAEQAAAVTEARTEPIERLFAGEPRVTVTSYCGLTGELVQRTGASFIVRGVRGMNDFETEMQLADANRRLFRVETVLIPARPELSWISSTAVRELQAFGADTSLLLPPE